MRVSLNRTQVEDALEQQGTTLAEYLAEGLDGGKSIETLTFELRNLTGVPFSVRTLYRWAEKLEKAS